MSEIFSDDIHTRGDVRLLEHAIRKGWDIPPQLMEAAPKVLANIMVKGKPREQVAAIRALAVLHEQNQPIKQVAHLHAVATLPQDDYGDDRKRKLAARIAALGR